MAVFGGGGLTNEKAYQLGKFARVALRHRADRLQRPLVHELGRGGRDPVLRARPGAALPGHRHRLGARGAAARREPGRDDAAVPHATSSGPPTPVGSWSRTRACTPTAAKAIDGGGLHLPAAPRHRPRPRARHAPPRGDRGLRRPATTSPRAPRGFDDLWPVGRAVVPGAGRAGHRRRGDDDARGRARRSPGPRHRARRLRPHRPRRPSSTRPAPTPSPPSSPWPSRSACPATPAPASARSPGRATARADASTARRPTSCPATARSTTRPRGRTSRRCGASTRTTCPGPGRSAFELLDSLGTRRRPAGAHGPRLQPRRVRARRAARDRAARLARPPRRLRLRPVRDRGDGRRRPAGPPVGRGGGHDDQPRGPRAASPPGRSTAPAGCRSELWIWSELARPDRLRHRLPHRSARGVRRAAPGLRRWPRRLLRP